MREAPVSSGRRLQQAPPSAVYATGCKAIDSILRDDVLPAAQDQAYLGPFTQCALWLQALLW